MMLWQMPFGQHAGAQVEVQTDLPVALVADEIIYDTEAERVTATGNVEVFYGDRTLTADKIIYDDRTGRIAAEGDLVLRDPSGATVFADAADLDAELRDGLVVGARSVLADHVRLSAVEARRVEARYNSLAKAVYSPCDVCPENPTPLWSIRARRVIHDEQEHIIHYESATFEVLGFPVLWLPYFQHYDPTIDRASGFLMPSFLSSSTFGYGIKVPYYQVIDPYSDLIVRPFVMTMENPILELEYRRLFSNGGLNFEGGALWSDYVDDEYEIHGFVDTDGLFDVGRGVNAGWDITFTSDDDFLRRFDYNYTDRLTSEIFAERYREDSFFDVSGVYFQSLRQFEPAGQIPLAVPLLDARHEVDDPLFGGEIGLFGSSYYLTRNNGRDTSRFSLGADWEREEILPFGLAVRGFAEGRTDIFTSTGNPLVTNSPDARVTGLAGVELRYPLIWEPEDGANHIIEPVVQGILAPYGLNDGFPDEDSLVNEFDELSVLDRNHFTGLDRFEGSPRVNLLLRYDRISDTGLNFEAVAGRTYRAEEIEAFSPGSGLRDSVSDFVTAYQVTYDPYLVVRHRLRFDDEASLSRNEVFGQVVLDPVLLSGSYAYYLQDPESDIPLDREEVTANAALQINRNWSVGGFVQRNLQTDEFVQVGGQLTWANECTAIDLFVRRVFTETVNAPASTSFGLNIRLLTLGAETAPVTSDRGLFSGGFGCG